MLKSPATNKIGSTSNHEMNRHGFVTRSITLEPGGVKSVGLGIYESKSLMPDFALTFDPSDMEDSIGVSLERLDVPGKAKYMPFYQFHNFGDKPCTITVSRKGESGR